MSPEPASIKYKLRFSSLKIEKVPDLNFASNIMIKMYQNKKDSSLYKIIVIYDNVKLCEMMFDEFYSQLQNQIFTYDEYNKVCFKPKKSGRSFQRR